MGKNEESFLPALLRSLDGVVDYLVVNDNSGMPDGPNARVLESSEFGRTGRLIVDRAAFVDFADARNRVLQLHRELELGDWAAFVDADEVHRPVAATIARHLPRLSPNVAVVDGYTRHYFQSFHWYTTIERRMSFFRVTRELHWTGRVHEQLAGINGKRLAIPYVYDHYGAVFPMERHAAKGRQYSSLGQAGATVTETEIAALSERVYFARLWPLVLRYHGQHPSAVADVQRSFENADPQRADAVEDTVAEFQPLPVRAANVLRRLNFEYRWRGRALDPRARAIMRAR